MTTLTQTQKSIYRFGNQQAEGGADMKPLLGGKGANLAEMNRIGIPVPAGFTITTEACNYYTRNGKEATKNLLETEVLDGIKFVEGVMEAGYGHDENPLLLSVRSGARESMPGMMDTVLNLGLNDQTVEILAKKSGNPRFAWDSYRRLIQMYGDVVMGASKQDNGEDPFEELLAAQKEQAGVELDNALDETHLKQLVARYKLLIIERTGNEFPQDQWEQIWGAIFAVFESWNNDRAEYYRKINNIPSDWGTAVNVQAMVFGNLGTGSATGVAFTRDAATGEDVFNGEFLLNAQGEDVVAGVRTPQQISIQGSKTWASMTGIDEEERKKSYPSLEELMPEVYQELVDHQQKLEDHYDEMQDIEFTIQNGKLWILQTRTGKRTAAAMVKIAMDMLREGRIDQKTMIHRIDPGRVSDLLHPVFKESNGDDRKVLAQGLPASPGAATGQIVLFADDVVEWHEQGRETILVRQETSPEDLAGMHLAKGILTSRGGMTSHAAIVARGMGKCCVAGAGSITINYKNKTVLMDGKIYRQGDWISLNGSTGEVYEGKIETEQPEISEDLQALLDLSDGLSRMQVWANADTPADAATARKFGAKGIGLARTEHMFFEERQIVAVREMILAENTEERRAALAKILPIQRADFEGLFESMSGYPVTIRLLDPPLHEFLPHEADNQHEMALAMGVPMEKIRDKVKHLEEANPMLGHRGCRLGNTYPEITEMQARAILEAALNAKSKGFTVKPEIMVPLVGIQGEFEKQKAIIEQTAKLVFEENEATIDFLIGTMIEVPRAALNSEGIGSIADFFSFGTNDLTQLTFGYSRDDIAKFLPIYLDQGILESDPFETIDTKGVGRLVRVSVEEGRKGNPDLIIGACGEHGGDPDSIQFFHACGLNYVSCSPFRIPIARIAAAQANTI